MKIFITSIGTRGDIEPFLAVGEILRQKGHEVVFSFPVQFADIVPKSAVFYPLSPKIIELIESQQGKILMGKAGLWAKFRALLYLYKEGQHINKILVNEQYDAVNQENPDFIIHHPKCSYPILWGLNQHKKTIILSPVPYVIHAVNNHPHLGVNKDLGSFLNKLTYKLANFGVIKTIYDAQQNLVYDNHFSKKRIGQALIERQIIYAVSPSLFKQPNYWPENAKVLGYHERNKTINWNPEPELEQFLMLHSKILFLTFGSMLNAQPKEISKTFYRTIAELDYPVIVNTSAGGLIKLPEFENNEKFYFVNNIPYEWIFPKVYAVVHHGGSGSTHMGLKYACPTLIIPHIIDQFGWNALVFNLKAGPKGVSINKINSKKIKILLTDLYTNKTYKQNAKIIAEQMSAEKLDEDLYDFIIQ